MAAPRRWKRPAIGSPASTSAATSPRSLRELKPDVAFNALHGPFGEDGCIQGILEILAIPYTHSGVLASALAMNKPKAKDVMKAAGIPVAESILANRFDAAKAHVMAPPYVVKPPNEGSSFGVVIVKEDARIRRSSSSPTIGRTATRSWLKDMSAAAS